MAIELAAPILGLTLVVLLVAFLIDTCRD